MSDATAITRKQDERSPFVRIKAVIHMTGLGRSTIYRLVQQNQFPRPVKLTARAVAWRRTELETWSAGRPSTSP